MADGVDTLSNATGSRIKLQLAASTLEGILFTYSPILNVIALNTSSSTPSQTADYHIIPVSAVQNVTVLAATSEGEIPQISRVDTGKLKAREEERVRKLQDLEAKRGKGVSGEGQRVFDALDRMYATRWHGLEIVVADAVIVAPPYTGESCRAPKEKAMVLAQIRKVVDGERRKMERARGASPVPPRKGG
ncbi:hypothetical protein MBLNU457_2333t2 [Dothideomycetes sp. NU457]